jgi:hypothetical protein
MRAQRGEEKWLIVVFFDCTDIFPSPVSFRLARYHLTARPPPPPPSVVAMSRDRPDVQEQHQQAIDKANSERSVVLATAGQCKTSRQRRSFSASSHLDIR